MNVGMDFVRLVVSSTELDVNAEMIAVGWMAKRIFGDQRMRRNHEREKSVFR